MTKKEVLIRIAIRGSCRGINCSRDSCPLSIAEGLITERCEVSDDTTVPKETRERALGLLLDMGLTKAEMGELLL